MKDEIDVSGKSMKEVILLMDEYEKAGYNCVYCNDKIYITKK